MISMPSDLDCQIRQRLLMTQTMLVPLHFADSCLLLPTISQGQRSGQAAEAGVKVVRGGKL